MMPIQETSDATKARTGSIFDFPEGSQILIVCEDSSAERLKTVFREAGVVSQTVKSMTAGCEFARSGRFQAIVSTPSLRDGSWGRLIDIANRYDLGFEIVLLVRHFDLAEWAEAMKDGAFDVLDVVGDLPRAAEVVKHALWAAYLRGAGPRPQPASSRKVA
jgi:DNA-binding NtrC family response regulator